MGILFLVAVLLAPQSAGDTPSTTEKVVSKRPPFSVEMPGKVREIRQRLPNPKGAPVRKTVYACESGGAHYSVQVTSSPEPISHGGEKAALGRYKAEFLQAGKKKPSDETAVTVGGYPGLDFRTRAPAVEGEGTSDSRERIVLMDGYYITLTVMAARNKPLPDNTAAFIASFRPAKSPDVPPAETPWIADSTPEEALRTFMAAVIGLDEPTIRAVTLPVEGMEWLWKGTPAPAVQVEEMRKNVARQKIRSLDAGDQFILPGGHEVTVRADEVGPDRAVLAPAGAPVPTRLRRVEGHWKIDARPIIAARKAADARNRSGQVPKASAKRGQ